MMARGPPRLRLLLLLAVTQLLALLHHGVSAQDKTSEESLAEEVLVTCPPDTALLPCRCRIRDSAEVQIWCSHSDLTRVLAPLRALSESRSGAKVVDELILEGNRLGALPVRAFRDLSVVRLMLRENELQRLSSGALAGQENAITELFVVEPALTNMATDALRSLQKLQAITLQTPSLRRLPRMEGLPALRYLRLEANERGAWRGMALHSLPALEQLHMACGSKGSGLDRLDASLLQGIPRLETLSVTSCALVWLHPHSLAPAANSLVALDLSDNLLDDVGQVALALRDLSRLSELKLERNQFRALPEGSLVSLPSLRALSLAGNQLTEVARGAFHLLPALEVLDLSRNSIKRLHPQAFTPRAAPRIQELDLGYNQLGHLAEVRPWVASMPTLRRLDVSANGIEELGWAALGPAGHPALERLTADHNNIRLVRRDALSALPALLELRLRNNSLDERALLERGSPWNLPGLKGLDLGLNALRSLDAQLLAGLPSLRRLDVSENRLTALQGSPFSPAPLLEHVNLSGNALTAMSAAALGPLRALYELDIARNRLVSLPAHPGRALSGLGVLNLANNQLASIPEGWTSGQATQTLQMSGNALRTLPAFSLPGLSRLDVSLNLLARIDSSTLASARELMYLNASNNEILHFPDGIRGLTSLRELDLSGNRLSSLPVPDVLTSLQSLRSLRLSGNQLATLSAGALNNMPRLISLGLAQNRLSKIEPGAVSSLPSLAELDLARNALATLPTASFSKLPSLRAASLKGNRLATFDAAAFESVPRLLLLDLSHNELRSVEWRPSWNAAWGGRAASRAFDASGLESDLNVASSASSSMPGLEVLDLSHNRLASFEDAGVANLPWLVELKMDNNEICGVRRSSLAPLSRLRVLSLRNNKVSMLQERAFRGLRGSMVHLDVAGNPLSCSCGLRWLQTWMESEPALQPPSINIGSVVDAAPRCADGSLLRDVRLSRSHCLDQQEQRKDLEDQQENEIMAACKLPPGSSQLMAPPSNLSPSHHLSAVAPNPEDSEYFYEEFVEYTQTGDEGNQTSNHSYPLPTMIVPSPSTPAPLSSHYTPGDTPTLYAGTIGIKPNNSIASNTVGHSNNDGPFTIFGYPLPSISSLWGAGGRHSGKRLEAQDGFRPIVTPYEDGFIPSLGPRLRPNWVLGPSHNNSTQTIHYESVSDQKKQVFTTTRQQHSLQNTAKDTLKNPLKFPNSIQQGPPVRSGHIIPIDHRGSLPIRESNFAWESAKPTENRSVEANTPVPTVKVVEVISSTPSAPLQQSIFLEPAIPEINVKENISVITQKGVVPLRVADGGGKDSTTASSIKKFNFESTTEYSTTTSPSTTQQNIILETTTQSKPATTTQLNVYFYPETTTTTTTTTMASTTTQVNTETTQRPPELSTAFTNLQLLVPAGGGFPSQGNKATITKVDNSASAKLTPSTSRYFNSVVSPNNDIMLTTTTSAPKTTSDYDQQGQDTSWYYRDYNKSNMNPFRGEFMSDDSDFSSTTSLIYWQCPPLLFFLTLFAISFS